MPGPFLCPQSDHGRPRGRRRRTVIRALAGIASMTAIGTAAAVPAATASSIPTYYVSTSASASGADTSCATAAYSTIQSAVTTAEATETTGSAAPLVYVCPGTYTEQITITKSLILGHAPGSGNGAVVIELPASVGADQSTGLSTTTCQDKDGATSTQVPQSVIEICGASATGANTKGVVASINDVTVEGNWPNSVCYGSLYDILVGGGAYLNLTYSAVLQAGAYPLNGCQGGVGVQVGYAPTGQVGRATLSYDTIDNYQKNGITVDGSGSTAAISNVTVTGDGPTNQIAQNGIQISFGATGTVTGSIISANNYTGTGEASSDGILVYGGGGSVCGIGTGSPLARKAVIYGNALINNDIGVQLFNVNAQCDASATDPSDEQVCDNTIVNNHGYPAGIPSADANISGYVTAKGTAIGDQAGISDSGRYDTICDNAISGIGYEQRDSASSLPNPAPPAWVRPIDIVSFAPALTPTIKGNTYDGKKYNP